MPLQLPYPILLLGKNGQVGRALAAAAGKNAIAVGHAEADFASPTIRAQLEAVLERHAPAAIVNAAAYTQVDLAEVEGREEAFRVNAHAVSDLAALCKERAIPLVHYSTDYVFDGTGRTPWKESDLPRPLNAYGESKLEGEKAIQATGGDYLIFRTSWVYDAQGKNFFNTMLRLMRERDRLNVVADQIGAPTYAPHLAQASIQALKHAMTMQLFPSGVYHLCNAGETSWHGFAQAILGLARTEVSGQSSSVRCQQLNPIPASAYPTAALRPANSRLDCGRARAVLGVALPSWEEGVRECFREKHADSQLPDPRPEGNPA